MDHNQATRKQGAQGSPNKQHEFCQGRYGRFVEECQENGNKNRAAQEVIVEVGCVGGGGWEEGGNGVREMGTHRDLFFLLLFIQGQVSAMSCVNMR